MFSYDDAAAYAWSGGADTWSGGADASPQDNEELVGVQSELEQSIDAQAVGATDTLAPPEPDGMVGDMNEASTESAAESAAVQSVPVHVEFALANEQAAFVVTIEPDRGAHSVFTVAKVANAGRNPEDAASGTLAADVDMVAESVRVSTVVVDEAGLYSATGTVEAGPLTAERAGRAVAATLLFALPTSTSAPFSAFFQRDASQPAVAVAYRDRIQQTESAASGRPRPWTVALASEGNASALVSAEVFSPTEAMGVYHVSAKPHYPQEDDKVIDVAALAEAGDEQPQFKFCTASAHDGTYYTRFFVAPTTPRDTPA